MLPHAVRVCVLLAHSMRCRAVCHMKGVAPEVAPGHGFSLAEDRSISRPSAWSACASCAPHGVQVYRVRRATRRRGQLLPRSRKAARIHWVPLILQLPIALCVTSGRNLGGCPKADSSSVDGVKMPKVQGQARQDSDEVRNRFR